MKDNVVPPPKAHTPRVRDYPLLFSIPHMDSEVRYFFKSAAPGKKGKEKPNKAKQQSPRTNTFIFFKQLL